MNHTINDTPDDDYGDEEFVEAEWVEPEEARFAQDRPRGLFDQDGPIAHLLGDEGPFGKGGVFGPGGPFGQQGPFGSGGPFGPDGPFGKGGPRRGRGFSRPADEMRAFAEEYDERGRGRGPRGRDERRGHGPRHDFGPERPRGFDAPNPSFGPQDSADAWGDATDRPRRGPGKGPRGPRGEGFGPHGHGPRGPRGEGRGPRGEGRGPRGEGRGPRGEGRGPRGRRRRGDVRLAALFLIAEEPRNGYQIIEELASRTGGHWRPSSGAIYPALAQLEDEGLIEAFDNEGRKAYRLTEAGKSVIAEAGDRPRPWEEAAQDAAQAFGGVTGGSMWASLAQVGMAAHAVTQAGDEAMVKQATGLLEETKKALYRLLAADQAPSDAPDEPTDPPQDGPQDSDD